MVLDNCTKALTYYLFYLKIKRMLLHKEKLIAFIEHLDNSIEKVLISLEKNHLIENTIIVLFLQTEPF